MHSFQRFATTVLWSVHTMPDINYLCQFENQRLLLPLPETITNTLYLWLPLIRRIQAAGSPLFLIVILPPRPYLSAHQHKSIHNLLIPRTKETSYSNLYLVNHNTAYCY